MKVLLDTNAFVALRRGHAEVADLVRRSESVVMSAVVVGELMYGFHAGRLLTRNRRELDEFLDSPHVCFVPVTLTTADRFGRIASTLRRKGTPVPSNDIWIAAHAQETGADLLSFDHHFARIDGLAWVCPDT